MSLDDIKQFLSETIGSHAKILDEAWSHHFRCDCDVCLSGWAIVGPDGGEPGSYGPFTKQQVNARQIELGVEETE